ncbi:protein TESPA1-like [Hippocampus comes]|uniref:protein TESPA1-like n=1 Tax=Hippocampus comes TaxID=109280 RepID=UPI00094E7C40|nr:PREDICTED: protein TESPA1-like [Hippocampus comes]
MHPASNERHIDLTSNVSEVLQSRSEDAEEMLWQLGFGCDDPQLTVRIPPRFLSFPSQVRGINFRLFLESQVRRIREEDPSLCIASKSLRKFIQ